MPIVLGFRYLHNRTHFRLWFAKHFMWALLKPNDPNVFTIAMGSQFCGAVVFGSKGRVMEAMAKHPCRTEAKWGSIAIQSLTAIEASEIHFTLGKRNNAHLTDLSQQKMDIGCIISSIHNPIQDLTNCRKSELFMEVYNILNCLN